MEDFLGGIFGENSGRISEEATGVISGKKA